MVQGGDKDGFVRLDFGLAEFDGLDKSERLRAYRKFLYEVGGLERLKGASIPKEIVSEESGRDFRLGRYRRFRYRTRYFSDSVIIGGRVFVLRMYDQFKDRLGTKNLKPHHSVFGLEDVFSLRKLSEG